jgi:hypothetical protein
LAVLVAVPIFGAASSKKIEPAPSKDKTEAQESRKTDPKETGFWNR